MSDGWRITNPSADERREWLDVNGRGGYASGTISAVNTRRYHALLLVARRPPQKRVVLVNQLAERLETPDGELTLVACQGDAGEPPERARMVEFAARPLPRWEYEAQGLRLTRTLVCPRGRDLVVVRWALAGPPGVHVRLHARPMLTVRADHDVVSADDAINTDATCSPGRVAWRPRPKLPGITAYGEASYRHEPEWRRGIEYDVDHERGEAWREDWWSPGEFTFELTTGEAVCFALSAESGDALDGEALFQAEEARRRASDAARIPTGNRLFDGLSAIVDTYAVTFEKGAALLAGFPWFDVWTRDTFTAFSGLFLATGRLDEARRVLETFAPLVDGGMLPNSLPVEGVDTRWNSVDASLCFVIAVGRYFEHGGVPEAFPRLWPAVRAILDGYRAGTSHEAIRVDDDGLLCATGKQALTWMDAEYEGRVMTPRHGKAVEVQALWARALTVGRTLANRAGDDDYARACDELRARTVASFRARFWYEKGGYLYDVVDGPDGDDATLRPNQVFAFALDDDLADHDRAARALDVVRARLLTPYGLRTLAEDDARFHPRYDGTRARRDPAYHQGTVWPFLLGPFVVAWVRVHGRTDESRREALGFLRGIEDYLEKGACPGHLCEIFDAVAPHTPRGCFAQAWSAGELLYALHTTLLDNRADAYR